MKPSEVGSLTLVELLIHPNPEVKWMAQKITQLLMEESEKKEEQSSEKFKTHQSRWN